MHLSSYLSRTNLLIVGLFILTTTIFISFPQIDIWTAAFFYDNQEGFYLKNSLFEYVMYYSVRWVLVPFVFGILIIWIVNRLLTKEYLHVTGRKVLFVLGVVIVGAILIVNLLFKDHFHRARPHHIVQFGGDKVFTPAFVISDQCETNCSFSSGHSAGAFLVMAFGFLLSRRLNWLMVTGFIYGVLVSIARMMAGGHFLSDTITSFFIILIVARLFLPLLDKK